jgi:hypothetical protein
MVWEYKEEGFRPTPASIISVAHLKDIPGTLVSKNEAPSLVNRKAA